MRDRPVVLLVLGMHRSGTSALTRVLNLLGAYLPGGLLGGNRSNPHGHWEPQRVVDIDEALLVALGRRWDDLRPLPADWIASPAAAIARDAIATFAAHELSRQRLSIIKDPRLCLLAPLWLEVLAAQGMDVRVIVPLRDPREVAASLRRRDGMAATSAYRLWQRHLVAAEAASRHHRRACVRFSDLRADWRGAVVVLAEALDVVWPNAIDTVAPAIDGFLAPGGVMFEDVPNLVSVFGYINASWTLKADLVCQFLCRLLRRMDERGMSQATPRNLRGVEPVAPWIEGFSPGYVLRSIDEWPKQGASDPWRSRQSFFDDWKALRFGALDDPELELSSPLRPARALAKPVAA